MMVGQGQIIIIEITLLGATGRSEGGGGTRARMRVAISIIKDARNVLSRGML
jgi:hypothetical protein